MQVLTDGGKLAAVHADHAKFVNLCRMLSVDFKIGCRWYSPCRASAGRTRLGPRLRPSMHPSEYIALLARTESLTFLSDLEAPDGVQPVVYSPL